MLRLVEGDEEVALHGGQDATRDNNIEEKRVGVPLLEGLTRLCCTEAMVPSGTAVLKNEGRGGVCCSLRRPR